MRRENRYPHVNFAFWRWKSQGPPMLAKAPSPKGGSSSVLPSPPYPFLGVGAEAGSWNADGH